MITLRFAGISPNIFGEVDFSDIRYCRNEINEMIAYEIRYLDMGLYVCGFYAGLEVPLQLPNSWIIGVQTIHEGAFLPDWSQKYYVEDGVMVFAIDVPLGTTITCVNSFKQRICK